ncbi:MAG: hypothetical protein J5I93_10595 [Pirellulaceae bacterium]|nr:hypothetical protein [Pirellulaceae bacterium]
MRNVCRLAVLSLLLSALASLPGCARDPKIAPEDIPNIPPSTRGTDGPVPASPTSP